MVTLPAMFDPGHTPQRPPLRLILAPMEGILDAIMREQLTAIGGYDRCVTEFVRVSQTVLPKRVFFVMPLNCYKADSLLQAPLCTFNSWALTPS